MADQTDANDPFADPGKGGAYPSIKQLNGRLLIVVPKRLEKDVPGVEAGKTQDRITADVHVLTGDTIQAHLDKDDNATPFDEPLVVPFKLEDMFISGAKLITELKGRLPRGDEQPGMVIGVLTKLKPQQKGRNGAWSLRPATPDEKAVGRKYLADVDPFA